MSIKLTTLVEDGLGTVAKVIVIDTAESYKAFQKLVHQGNNLYPNNPVEIKELADMVSSGKVLQEYKELPKQEKQDE